MIPQERKQLLKTLDHQIQPTKKRGKERPVSGGNCSAARRRFQSSGYLHRKGNWWRLQYYKDFMGEDGLPVRRRPSEAIGLCVGPQALTEKQAKRIAAEILSRVDAINRVPQSIITLASFVEHHFTPEYCWTLKHAGKLHYKHCLKKIVAALGTIKLCDLAPSEINKFLKGTIESGKSVQTATHYRNALSAVIKHAKHTGFFTGENPCSLVRLPVVQARETGALTPEQADHLLQELKSPLREMAHLSMTSSPNVAELCALRWKRVNLTSYSVIEAGKTIEPYCALIVENYYEGVFGTVKAGRRNRMIPLFSEVVEELKELKARTKFAGPDDLVFTTRVGTPIKPGNANIRYFKPIGEKLGVRISWHVLRHTCATRGEAVGMLGSDRQALLGHASASMTARYTHADIERMREAVERIGKSLRPEKAMVMVQ
jgi:integrase